LDRQGLYLTTLIVLVTIALSVLTALSESRLDVYVSVLAIIYFATTVVFRPRKRTWDLLALALLVAFMCVVAVKVLEVLLKP